VCEIQRIKMHGETVKYTLCFQKLLPKIRPLYR